MKSKTLLILSVVLGLQSGSLWAGSFPGAISRDSLVVADSLNRLSVGVDFEAIKRDIVVGDAEAAGTLEARSIDGFFGVDVTSWLSPFFTLGASSALDPNSDEYGDYKFKWSAGVNLNIWHYDIVSPDFLSGRLSIESMVEYASYASENVGNDGNDMEWTDLTVILPVCYEMFEDISPIADKSLRTSLNLYVGPALSVVDGTFLANDATFSEDQQFGFIGGADIFLAEKVSIGAHVLVFDQASVTGTIRYHF